MTAQLIKGAEVAAQIREVLKREIAELKAKHNVVPGLVTVLVGADPASQVYVGQKEKTSVETPEGEFQDAIFPMGLVDQSPPGEQQKGDGKHAVGSEHGRVAVVHGQVSSVLIVIDNGKINQESKDAGTQEVPERGGHQEIHGPLI